MDYTTDGIRAVQMDLTVSYLNLIDSKLKKINKNLSRITTMAIVAAGVIMYKHRRTVKEKLNNLKGE